MTRIQRALLTAMGVCGLVLLYVLVIWLNLIYTAWLRS